MKKAEKVTLQDFTTIKTIGKGGFSTVFLAKHNPSEKLYALKVMKKKKVS